MKIDFSVECAASTSPRARQVSSMFDAPPVKKCRIEYAIEFPIEAEPWNVGLVVGPSGSGKSSVMREVWGEQPELKWDKASIVDDFAEGLSIEQISNACSAVGFNTIPAWMRPYHVLSNGEKFRVDLSRRLLELPDPIIVDEFSSVVDRQVAQVGSYAVQKYVRKHNRQFVAIGCHYDVIDWLSPDWVLDMASRTFARRSLQRRPKLDVTISRVSYSAWHMFAPFHYMTGNLHRGARCFGLWVGDRLTCFAGILHRPPGGGPNSRKPIKAVSRIVTLPDWQGLGLAFVLLEKLGAAYKALGYRFRNYPAHPAFVRAHAKSSQWRMDKQAGKFSIVSSNGKMGGRPCGIFEYIGPAMGANEAALLIANG